MYRILIVEDDSAIANLLEINLKVAGYETAKAADGNTAEKLLLENECFDLALLDIMLPVWVAHGNIRWSEEENYTDVLLDAQGCVRDEKKDYYVYQNGKPVFRYLWVNEPIQRVGMASAGALMFRRMECAKASTAQSRGSQVKEKRMQRLIIGSIQAHPHKGSA